MNALLTVRVLILGMTKSPRIVERNHSSVQTLHRSAVPELNRTLRQTIGTHNLQAGPRTLTILFWKCLSINTQEIDCYIVHCGCWDASCTWYDARQWRRQNFALQGEGHGRVAHGFRSLWWQSHPEVKAIWRWVCKNEYGWSFKAKWNKNTFWILVTLTV